MKIAVITCNTPCQRYFANKIDAAFGIDTLFLVRKRAKNFYEYSERFLRGIAKHWQKGHKTLAGTVTSYRQARQQNAFFEQMYPCERERREWEKKILGDSFEKLHKTEGIYDIYRTANRSLVETKMAKLNPDVLLVFGGGIVGNKIIKTVEKASINLHWGLSPYYRGGRTTIWPIYNDEPEFIGVTIHRLTQKIDGGEIITQAQPDLSVEDNLYSVELKLTKLGTSLMLRTLSHLHNYKIVPSSVQDFSKGKLYLGKYLTPSILQNIHTKLTHSYFKTHLPCEKDYEKVELIKHL